MTVPSVAPIVPPVAEVVARYRGRIVDIQHVRWSEPPAVAPAAYLGAGAVLLLLGLALGLSALAQVEAASLCDAPPCPDVGVGAGLGALLIAVGLVPLVLGLVRWRDRALARYTIGEAPGVDLTVALPGAPADGVPLVIALEQGIVLGLPPGVRGRIDGPTPIDLAEAAAQGRRSLALPAGARANLEVGALTFEIAEVPPADVPRSSLEFDRLAWLSHLGAAALIGGVVLHLESTEPAPLELDREAQIALVTRYITSPSPTPQDQPPASPITTPPPAARRVTAPARPPAPEEPPPAPSVVVDEDSGLVAPAAPTMFPRRGKSSGRNDSIHDYDRVAGILGDPGFNEAVDDYTVAMKNGQRVYRVDAQTDAWWAQATGGPPSTSRHFGGLELAETERGGGLHPTKQAAKKPVSSVTLSAAARDLPPPTREELARIRRIVQIDMDPPTLADDPGIDRLTLYQYARKHMAGWRTCYEDALDKRPDMTGVMRFKVKFDVAGKATVAEAQWSTGTIGAIEACLAAAARKWKLEPLEAKPTTAIFHLQFSSRTR